METNEWEKDFDEDYEKLRFWELEDADKVKDFISQNFIPISELKSWVEENKKEIFRDATNSTALERFNRNMGHNSALKALSDRFIKE